jgi:hypothetical protein
MKYGSTDCYAHLICPPHYYHNYSRDAYQQIIFDSCAACPVGYENVYGLGAECTSCDLQLINFAPGTPCQRCAPDSFLHRDQILQQVKPPYCPNPFTHISASTYDAYIRCLLIVYRRCLHALSRLANKLPPQAQRRRSIVRFQRARQCYRCK